MAIGILYIAGTSALFMALSAQQINAISGIPQALSAIAMRAGVPMFGFIAAALVTLSQIGSLGAWITGTARLPFLFGLHRYLPEALGAVHPLSGSPYVALLTLPPADSSSPILFAIKVIGGCAVLLAAGLVLFVRGGRRV